MFVSYSQWHRFASAITLSLLATGLWLLPDFLQAQLDYFRPAIEQGQWWRLVSGHLLHTNGWHLAMNLAALWLLAALHGHYFRPLCHLVMVLLLAISCSLLLYATQPELKRYVGLSGLLHGLFLWGVVADIRYRQKGAYLLLAGLIIKIGWEQWHGPDPAVEQLINARVATEAHLTGTVAAILLLPLLNRACVTASPDNGPQPYSPAPPRDPDGH